MWYCSFIWDNHRDKHWRLWQRQGKYAMITIDVAIYRCCKWQTCHNIKVFATIVHVLSNDVRYYTDYVDCLSKTTKGVCGVDEGNWVMTFNTYFYTPFFQYLECPGYGNHQYLIDSARS